MKVATVSTAVDRVKVLDLARATDRASWLALWKRWPGREVMAHPDYVRLFARPGDRVLAFTFRGEEGAALYPVIQRPISREPWGLLAGKACDLTTAYGYGGPFGWKLSESEQREFWAGVDAWAAAEEVVTSFARLSLFPESQLAFNGTVEARAANIVRRLDVPVEEMWSDYDSKVRKNVRRARSLDVTVEADSTGRRLDEFLEVYKATMDRRGACSHYYHPRSFFQSIVHDLEGHFVFVHALHQGRVIASELVLLSEERAYSFLGGSRDEGFDLRAIDLLKHEINCWCRLDGKRELVMGGGYREGDGIFKFKKAFAPGGEVRFRVGCRVYDAERAAQIREFRRRHEAQLGSGWTPATGHFPEYRA